MNHDTTIPHFSAVDIIGPDAPDFLQGQLTIDTRLLARDALQHGAWLTPKGRIFTTFDALAIDDGVRLFVPTPLRDRFVKRLTMYRLRAKCEIAAGEAMLALHTKDPGHGAVRALGDRGPWEVAATAGASAASDHYAKRFAFGFTDSTIDSSEKYTAHQLNLDLLNAISFTKGCYTGQEIVARTQHLGRVKRRALRYRGVGDLQAVRQALHDEQGNAAKLVAAVQGDDDQIEIRVLGEWPSTTAVLVDANNNRYEQRPFTGYTLPDSD